MNRWQLKQLIDALSHDWEYTLEEKMADLATAIADLTTAVAALAARVAALPDTQGAADAIEGQVAALDAILPAPAPAEAPPA